MGFVHGQQSYFDIVQGIFKRYRFQPLGRNVKKPEMAVYCPVQDIGYRLIIQARVDGGRRDAPFFKLENLVFHQGDQRRNDHAYPFHHQPRNLETDGFTATCRQNGQGVSAGQNI
ncbi:hypothetical protein D9M69_559780 [compost metagenome]